MARVQVVKLLRDILVMYDKQTLHVAVACMNSLIQTAHELTVCESCMESSYMHALLSN